MADASPILASALKQIEADLAQIPPGVDRVMVVAADEKGATVGFAGRVGEGWSLSMSVEQRWKKQRPNARVVLKREW